MKKSGAWSRCPPRRGKASSRRCSHHAALATSVSSNATQMGCAPQMTPCWSALDRGGLDERLIPPSDERAEQVGGGVRVDGAVDLPEDRAPAKAAVVEGRVVGQGHLGLPEAGALAQGEHGAEVEKKRVRPVQCLGAQDCARRGGQESPCEVGTDRVLALRKQRFRPMLGDVRGGETVHHHGELFRGDHEDPPAPVHTPHPVDHLVRRGRLGGLGRLGPRLDDVIAPDEKGAEQPGLPVEPGRVGTRVGVAVEAPRLRWHERAELSPPPPGKGVAFERARGSRGSDHVGDGGEVGAHGSGRGIEGEGRGVGLVEPHVQLPNRAECRRGHVRRGLG